jgi:hypothetical protein
VTTDIKDKKALMIIKEIRILGVNTSLAIPLLILASSTRSLHINQEIAIKACLETMIETGETTEQTRGTVEDLHGQTVGGNEVGRVLARATQVAVPVTIGDLGDQGITAEIGGAHHTAEGVAIATREVIATPIDLESLFETAEGPPTILLLSMNSTIGSRSQSARSLLHPNLKEVQAPPTPLNSHQVIRGLAEDKTRKTGTLTHNRATTVKVITITAKIHSRASHLINPLSSHMEETNSIRILSNNLITTLQGKTITRRITLLNTSKAGLRHNNSIHINPPR